MNPLIRKVSADIGPAEFIPLSSEKLQRVAKKMQDAYAAHKPEVANEWKEWIDTVAPKNDNVHDYVADHPLHIPFHHKLFGADQIDPENITGVGTQSLHRKNTGAMRVVTNTNCVLHAGNKKKVPPREIILEANGTEPEKRRGVMPSVYPGRIEKPAEDKPPAKKKPNRPLKKLCPAAHESHHYSSSDTSSCNELSDVDEHQHHKPTPGEYIIVVCVIPCCSPFL